MCADVPASRNISTPFKCVLEHQHTLPFLILMDTHLEHFRKQNKRTEFKSFSDFNIYFLNFQKLLNSVLLFCFRKCFIAKTYFSKTKQ